MHFFRKDNQCGLGAKIIASPESLNVVRVNRWHRTDGQTDEHKDGYNGYDSGETENARMEN